jgi:hypothetical protein
MKSLINRLRKAEVTPTAAERLAIQKGQAAAKQQGRDGEKMPDPNEDHAAFLEALTRSHERHLAKYPPGYRPLDAALRAFDAVPVERTRPPIKVPEGAGLIEVLQAFRRRARGEDDDEQPTNDEGNERDGRIH